MKSLTTMLIIFIWSCLVLMYDVWVFEYLQHYIYPNSFFGKCLEAFCTIFLGVIAAVSPVWWIFGIYVIIAKRH